MKPGPDSTKDPGLSFEAVLAVPQGQAIDRDTLKPEERALVSLTDGQRNVGDLLRLTGLSGFVVMRVLRSLRERGVLVQVGNVESPATTGELAAISGTIGGKIDKTSDRMADKPEKKTGGDAVPAARDKEKEKSGPARKATQDMSKVIAQRVRLRTPMMPPLAKAAGTSEAKTEAKPANTAPAAGRNISLNNAPTLEMQLPPPESRDESELFPGPPEPERKVEGTPRPATGPLSRTVIGIPAVRINQGDQASRPVIPGGKSSKPAAPSPNDTLVDAGPPVPVSDLSAVGGSQSPVASFRVGNYDVITRIAQGGMGSIYLCRRSAEMGFQRLFVLKAVRQHSAQTEAAIRSFQREARIGGLLAHPNVLS